MMKELSPETQSARKESQTNGSPVEVLSTWQKLKSVVESQHFGLVGALIVLIVVLSLGAPYFMTIRNFTNVLQQVSFLGIIAMGMTLVIVCGEIDISVGSAMALYSSLIAVLNFRHGWPLWLAIALALVIGICVGLFAGYIRHRFKIPSFIVTLALLSSLRGAALWMTNASPIAIPDRMFAFLGSGRIFGVLPFPLLVFIVISLVYWFVSTKTVFGRSVYAVGGNPEAARISGISLLRVRMLVFAGTGLLAAVSAVMLSSLIGSGNAGLGNGAEFQVIAAVIVGGTSLYGGRGSIWGTVLGVLFIGLLTNGMVLLNVNQYGQMVAQGVIILGAVLASETLRRT
jgi:sugar transport system permease protein